MEAANRRLLPPIFWNQDLSKWAVFSRIAFAVLLGWFLISSFVCTVSAVGWVGQPFPGFIILENLIVERHTLSSWTGVQAGVRFLDKIMAVDGQSVKSVEEIAQFVRRLGVGTTAVYRIQRRDEVIEVPIATMIFKWIDFLAVFGVMFSTGGGILFLGVLVFVLKPDTEVSWTFFLCGLLVGMDFFNVFDYQPDSLGMVRIIHAGALVLPAVVIHLSSVFPGEVEWLRRHRLIGVPYVLSALLIVGMEGLYHNHPLYATFHHVTWLYYGLSTLTLLVSIAISFWKSASVLRRTRAKVLLFGVSLGLPIPIGMAILKSYGVYPVGIPTTFTMIPLLILPATMAYAIVKHNLFDVDVYIKRTVGYAIMATVVGGFYFAIETVTDAMVVRPTLGSSGKYVSSFVFALLVVLFFNPINRHVQGIVDKLFFRKSSDYKKTVASMSEALNTFIDLDRFIQRTMVNVRNSLFVDRVAVVLCDPTKKTCTALVDADPSTPNGPAKPDPCLVVTDPLFRLLAAERRLITKYDIAENPRYAAVREPCGRAFAELGASVALPLFNHDAFSGVLALGYKKSGHFFSRDDVELLGTVSAMTSTAIEQAREKEQRGTLMKLFSKHVSPEVADALWEQRDQFLEGGRPRSQKLMATIMFTDLQGFSGVSEKFEPETLMEWINTYMEATARMVMDHGGVVDDYFGDGVKINFGVPIPRMTEAEIKQDARNAVDCALALEEEMRRLNLLMNARELPTLRMRIGINTGLVVAGSLGSADRMKYTTLGDTVNTASRLESFDKSLSLPHLELSPCRILVADSTLRYLDEEFETHQVGELTLKGKEERITAHCVIRRRADASRRSRASVSQSVAGEESI